MLEQERMLNVLRQRLAHTFSTLFTWGKLYAGLSDEEIELIKSFRKNKKPDIDKMLKDLKMIKPVTVCSEPEVFSDVKSLHKDLEKEMCGKIIRGTLNGAEVSEQWINVNNAVVIAKKYMAKVESNLSTLSDTEKEIIEDLRKAKEAGVSMNNFSMLRGAGGTMIQEGLNMFISGATITGGTINK